MSRPELDHAWKEMEIFVRDLRKSGKTDDAAIVATMLQFSSFIHIKQEKPKWMLKIALNSAWKIIAEQMKSESVQSSPGGPE